MKRSQSAQMVERAEADVLDGVFSGTERFDQRMFREQIALNASDFVHENTEDSKLRKSDQIVARNFHHFVVVQIQNFEVRKELTEVSRRETKLENVAFNREGNHFAVRLIGLMRSNDFGDVSSFTDVFDGPTAAVKLSILRRVWPES